jgi:DNA polymerase sigma
LGAKREVNPAGKQEFRHVSAQPVLVPTFVASDFDTQVHELLVQIAPSAEGDKLVHVISLAVKAALSNLIPEAEVMGFSNGDVLRGTAFAVAIPEVDIVLNADPNAIIERLRDRASRPLSHASKLDARTLQKALLRACIDELAAVPGFKFRRSAFKSQEPKVTFMAEMHGKAIPIDFSVNTATPLHNAALLAECGQIEPRAKELILFVRRWAKDRGVSHAAKGHLSPYAWSLLVIYFLQVWDEQGEPLLSKITSFKLPSGLLRKQHKECKTQMTDPSEISAQVTSVACLFEQFVHFYTKTFNSRNEAVSVRAGTRKPPSTSLPLHIVTLESGATRAELMPTEQ